MPRTRVEGKTRSNKRNLNSQISVVTSSINIPAKRSVAGIHNQTGQGIVSALQNLGARLTDDKNNPKNRLYPSEKHALLYNTTLKRYEPAQFMGPGTEYLKRSKLGQNGVALSDTASKAHDIRYALGTSNADIKSADDKFYSALNRLSRDKTDVPFNINQGKLLRIKDFIPGIGSTYGDKKLTEQDKEYLRGELAKLSARGFGNQRKRAPRKK